MSSTGNLSDRSGDVPRHETIGMISSDKVEGTSVYDANRNAIGSIHSVMIGKTDGKVAYAVLSFGGFLGIGTDYYPVPWNQLHYDTLLEGYVIGLTREQIEGAPRFAAANDWYGRETRWATDVDAYYARPGFPAH